MPGLTKNPSWIPIPNTHFERYLPVIKRWVKESKSKITHTEQEIRSLFVKIFYIAISESVLKPDYPSFLNPEFLRKYNLKKSQFNRGLSTLPDVLDISHAQMADQEDIKFYTMVIHRVFNWITEKLAVRIKSELKTPITISFMKLYELKMLVKMIFTDFSTISKSFLQYGGIPAAFTEFLSSYCQTTRKAKTKKQLSRKTSGSVFTPLWIIKLIHTRLEKHLTHRESGLSLDIGDISVGYGGFLEDFLKIQQNTNLNLHGFDADPYKIDVLKLNHSILYSYKFFSIDISNFRLQDSLIHPSIQKFDILVGNPPWGAKLNKSMLQKTEDLSDFTIKQYDSYGLFLIRNILSLKESGLLYLVLPETILLSPNYKEIRKFILEHAQILDIFYLGEDVFDGVNMPAVIIGMQKLNAPLSHTVNIFLTINPESDLGKISTSDKSKYIIRNQHEFLDNQGYEFDIFTNNEDRQIIERIDSVSNYKLQDLVDNSRGVEIGKKGDVAQCYHCNVWMPVPVWSLDPHTGTKFANCGVCKQKIYVDRLKNRDRIILDNIPKPNPDLPYTKFLIGENIHKYFLSGNKFLLLGRRGIKYKTAKIYNQNKILIRKTSKELLATIDYDKSYTIQVVYQFSLKEQFKSHQYLLEFILGIISSHIVQFYYAKKFQYTNRKSFPHHIQKNILILPVPNIEFKTKNTKYSEFYAQVVFSTMMLMFLSQFHESQSINKPLALRLSKFIKDNPNLLKNIELREEEKENLFRNMDQIKNYSSKLKSVENSIVLFQKILDDTVERLFLALE